MKVTMNTVIDGKPLAEIAKRNLVIDNWDGKYILLEDAYCDNVDCKAVYVARAVKLDDEYEDDIPMYRMHWNIISLRERGYTVNPSTWIETSVWGYHDIQVADAKKKYGSIKALGYEYIVFISDEEKTVAIKLGEVVDENCMVPFYFIFNGGIALGKDVPVHPDIDEGFDDTCDWENPYAICRI